MIEREGSKSRGPTSLRGEQIQPPNKSARSKDHAKTMHKVSK